jgi:regulatory protein
MSALRQRAIKLLARREHTRAELAAKLKPYGAEDEIETVVSELAGSGLQSDERFAESYIRSRSALLGASRLRQALRQKGVASELIDVHVTELPAELDRARTVWQKKFPAAPINRNEWARQARFLQSRGFSSQIVCAILKEIEA